jgi:hypothetical protein
MNASRGYRLLRFIATLLKVVAFLLLIAGVIGLVAGLGAAGGLGPNGALLGNLIRAGSWMMPLLAIIGFVQLYAFGSIISLLLDIEETTRAMASQQ